MSHPIGLFNHTKNYKIIYFFLNESISLILVLNTNRLINIVDVNLFRYLIKLEKSKLVNIKIRNTTNWILRWFQRILNEHIWSPKHKSKTVDIAMLKLIPGNTTLIKSYSKYEMTGVKSDRSNQIKIGATSY